MRSTFALRRGEEGETQPVVVVERTVAFFRGEHHQQLNHDNLLTMEAI